MDSFNFKELSIQIASPVLPAPNFSLSFPSIRENGVLLVPLAKMVSQGCQGFKDPLELQGLLERKETR